MLVVGSTSEIDPAILFPLAQEVSSASLVLVSTFCSMLLGSCIGPCIFPEDLRSDLFLSRAVRGSP